MPGFTSTIPSRPSTTTIYLDDSFEYQVTAYDPEDPDSLDFQLIAGPEEMLMGRLTGQLTWTPVPDDVGTHMVTVRVTDTYDDYQDQSFDLRVREEGEPPTTTNIDAVTVIAIATGAILIGLAAIVTTTEFGKYSFVALLLPLYVKMAKKEVLDNNTRYALQGIIIEHPGIHYHAILREFDLQNGAAVYHLSVLEREGYIRSVRDGRLKRYYVADTKVPSDIKPSPDALREDIIYLVDRSPGLSQKEISEELGIDRNTTGYHLRDLVSKKRIKASRRGKFTVYWPRFYTPPK